MTHALPWGWSQEDVDREPLKAVLEHTYGNCPCDTPEKCLCAIAALVEPLVPQPTSCENKNACSLAGNDGHLNCTPDPELITLIRNEAADAAAERIEIERREKI